MRYYNVPEKAKKKRTNVVYVPKKIGPGKYYGMTHPASKVLPDSGKLNIKSNEIFIYDKQNPFRKEEDLRHELIERPLLKAGFPYENEEGTGAHQTANILQGERDLMVHVGNVRVRGDGSKRGTIRRRPTKTQSML
jgi:hypothetical protein